MEGTQTTKKRRSPAFIAMLTCAMFFCMGRPASAQFPQVTPNGVGDLLIYQYWFTQNPQVDVDAGQRDSLIALINAFGGQAQRFVHIRVFEGIRSQDVRNFTVCLSPGDVWTAAISPSLRDGFSNLVVGNPGSCDALVGGSGFTPPPEPGQIVSMQATFGYIEAYTMEPPGGGDDTIFGVATPVNVQAGFSSSYNAIAFVGFDATHEDFTVRGNSAIAQALAREGGVDKEIFMTRWFADPDLNAITQIILTFPGGYQPGTGDPVSAYVFDEEENLNFSPRSIVLPWEVNACTLVHIAGTTRLSCAGSSTVLEIEGRGGPFISGWVRIINNRVGAEVDSINTPPATRFPATGLVFSFFMGDDAYDQSFNIHWAAVRGVGGIGGVDCLPVPPAAAGPNCRSFDIASTFAPWFVPPAGPADGVPPGDNVMGALNRTGTVVP